MAEEIKRIKKQLSLGENEARSAIIGSYVSKYSLYEKIYNFYWNIFIGKKPLYPLSSFLKLLMINSTRTSYHIFR